MGGVLPGHEQNETTRFDDGLAPPFGLTDQYRRRSAI